MKAMRWALWGLGGAGLAAAAVWALWPEPVAVDLAEVRRGPLEVTLSAEGKTRVREPYTITAPIAGMTARAPVAVGDAVVADETVVAVLRPADPALMDARTRAQAEAAVAEAEAAVTLAEANLDQARNALDHARTQYDRGAALAAAGSIPQRMQEDLLSQLIAARQGLIAAEAERDLRLAALRRARAQLLAPDPLAGGGGGNAGGVDAEAECCVTLRAPVSGTVLDIPDRNARQVAAGTPLLTLGDTADLEIEIDLLSSDAVRVAPGMEARVTRWGGEGVLAARVRRIEPAAFTRVSALGIEEQRVRLQLDLLSPPAERAGLGEQFRVLADLVLWEGEDVVQVPHGALFRDGEGWAVFRKIDGRAVPTPVTQGRRGATMAQITDGLSPGDLVVMFPPNSITEGSRITAR